MKRIALLVLVTASLLATACKHGPIASIRNPEVYQAELDYNDMVQTQAVKYLRSFIAETCSCDAEGNWSSRLCSKAAKASLVIEVRGPYHRDLSLYNGSLLGVRPPEEPPVIPDASTLCPAPKEAEAPAEGVEKPEHSEAPKADEDGENNGE